jgi:hypothetical protein
MFADRLLAALVVSAIVTVTEVPDAAFASDSLPRAVAPTGLSTKDEPGGGRIVSGLVPDATTSIDATRKALEKMRGYFDHRPNVRGAVASADRRSSIVFFDAELHGDAVRGLIVTAVQTGTAEVAFLFDNPQQLERSLPAMEADLSSRGANALRSEPTTMTAPNDGSLSAQWNDAAARAHAVALQHQTFSDSSGSVGVATGFSLNSAQVGSFDATASDDARIRVNVGVPAYDPRAGGSNVLRIPLVSYSGDPGDDWIAVRRAYMERSGTPDDGITIDRRFAVRTVGNTRQQTLVGRMNGPSGKAMTYIAWVTTGEPTRGIWTVQFNIVRSPVDRLAGDGPKLIGMLESFRSNQGVITSEIQSFEAQNAAKEQGFAHALVRSNQISRETLARNSELARQQSADAQDWISREGASTIHMLRGDDAVFTADGAHVTVPLGTSLGYGSVPITQYIKGIDY